MFGGRINWIDLIKQDNFDIEYCNNVLKKFENNLSVTFDDNEAQTVKYTPTRVNVYRRVTISRYSIRISKINHFIIYHMIFITSIHFFF